MRHTKLRSFPTKCKNCGNSILYWESTSGAKIFFNLPIYGKPLPHRCLSTTSKKKFYKESYHEHQIKYLNKTFYNCPVCNKSLKTESALDIHMKALSKQDEAHSLFFKNTFDLLNWERDEEMLQNDGDLSQYQIKHDFKHLQKRLIIKSKDPQKKKKFENLFKRKE